MLLVSKNKKKKIDVFDQAGRQYEIGDINYGDYHVYKHTVSNEYENQRKKLYHTRNKNILIHHIPQRITQPGYRGKKNI